MNASHVSRFDESEFSAQLRWLGVSTAPAPTETPAKSAILINLEERPAPRGPLPVVLDTLCRTFDSAAEGCSSSVLLPDGRGTRVRRVIGPGLPDAYNEFLTGQLVSCVQALGQPRSEWPPLRRTHGLECLGSSPILSSAGDLVGIFALYWRPSAGAKPCAPRLLRHFSAIAGIAIDRARIEVALKRTEAQLASTHRLSSTGSFSWRPATDEISGSEEFHCIFELDPAAPVTLDLIRARVHPEDVAKFREMTALARTGSDLRYEYRLRMPTHAVKYIGLLAHGTLDEEGQLEYIGAIQDVTGRRLSEEALGKLRAELAHVTPVSSLGALTASVAHEVSQPLSGIVTNASACLRMLALEPPDLEGARVTVQRTIRDGHRAADVIKQLRALFRECASTGSVDLNEATAEVAALLWSELQRSGVILRTEFDEALPTVAGDRVQLQQVVLNLLLNACEAMSVTDKCRRHLMIKTERVPEGGVRLRVTDSGVGLPPKSDIGLSISRSILENHGGHLSTESNGGPGSTFSFCIPGHQSS